MKRFFILNLLFLFLLASGLKAEIKLPTIFGNNMVLQQQTDAAIWGMADANKTVKITTSCNKKSYSAKAGDDGNWKINVATPAAGGPFSITISDGESITLDNVLIGEVWVCSGQSNMQMPMRGYRNQPVYGANEAIATSSNKNIRLFTVERAKTLSPLEDFNGEWEECIPANVVAFSATAYFFGRMVNQALDVPVGLICSSWGGTRIEPWMSEAGIQNFDFVELPDKNKEGEFSQQTPTVLFNAMIAPMVGYGIRGGLWYQGEANRNQPLEYEKLMQGLIENWRDEWAIGEFPFYFCQIAPFDYGQGGINSAFVRDAQRKAALNTPNAGMACLMDAGEEDNIHPGNKKAAGERLAFWALAKTYGMEGIEYSGPEINEMTVEGHMVHLTFTHASNGFTTYGKPLNGFLVAGKDKNFRKANAWITNKGITLFNERIKEPVAVRYAWEDFTIGELFNTEGLPASSFRTDDWDVK
jgi:sialate O-acetylesterase